MEIKCAINGTADTSWYPLLSNLVEVLVLNDFGISNYSFCYI